ncbi:MAG: hypothetical protein HY293_20255 [Planctomycetes bacterium]|nr:hypothetical protein [Planctomycetota bacterium]
MIDEWVKTATPPVLPSCIVPIATSNGLWIDPALPLLNRKQDSHGEIFWFAAFCMNCKGFSVN